MNHPHLVGTDGMRARHEIQYLMVFIKIYAVTYIYFFNGGKFGPILYQAKSYKFKPNPKILASFQKNLEFFNTF